MEEFNITEFIKYYFSKIAIIIIFIVIGGLGAWYYTANLQVPMYKSETKLVLASTNEITQNDISINKNLVSNYRELIKSRRILTPVIENLKLDMKVSELSQKVTVTSVTDTEIIVITVTDENSRLAKRIANEIAEVFIEEIPEMIPNDNINLVDKAIEAEDAYNVKPVKQYAIGIMAGFLLASGIVTVVFYFDDTIKNSEDIETKTELSVLSTVPKYKNKMKKNKNK